VSKIGPYARGYIDGLEHAAQLVDQSCDQYEIGAAHAALALVRDLLKAIAAATKAGLGEGCGDQVEHGDDH
jgi:hypothetical protein